MVWDGVEPEEGDGRYASPQVIQGFSQLEVKALAPCDVYALGASVFELALGKSLTGRDPQYLQVREGAPVELADTSTLGKALASILTEMMHPSAEDRIDCATAVKLARDALAQLALLNLSAHCSQLGPAVSCSQTQPPSKLQDAAWPWHWHRAVI